MLFTNTSNTFHRRLLLGISSLITASLVLIILLGNREKLSDSSDLYLSYDVDEPAEACPNGTIVMASGGGNTGNAVWEYLSVLAVVHLLPDRHLKPYITFEVKRKVEEVYQTISLPLLSSVPAQCCLKSAVITHDSHSIADIDQIAGKAKCIVLDLFAARYQDVIAYGIDNVRKNLKFRDEVVEAVQIKLGQIRESFIIPEGIEETFVGVHYRGGDYEEILKFFDDFKNFPRHTYFLKAMDYFKARYEFPIFVFVTSDYDWLDANLSKLAVWGTNVFVQPFIGDKTRDLALLAHCNHSIITYGSFGATGAFYNGGEAVVYDLEMTASDHIGPTIAMAIARVKNNWILMKN